MTHLQSMMLAWLVISEACIVLAAVSGYLHGLAVGEARGRTRAIYARPGSYRPGDTIKIPVRRHWLAILWDRLRHPFEPPATMTTADGLVVAVRPPSAP
jgi:hypothetical protein